MRKSVYNLEFPSWCPSLNIYGYEFSRVENYKEKVLQLQHLMKIHSEFVIKANTGQHAITAYVELPSNQDKPSLAWNNSETTALDDILLLLSIFTGRDVFVVEEFIDSSWVITADSRLHQWGGSLRTSIPYKESEGDDMIAFRYDIGFEEGLNQIYNLIRTNEWLKKYQHGYFLFLARQAFRRQNLESAFTQCWTIWEHLFAIHNRHWLADDTIRRFEAIEKIAFILTEYELRNEIDGKSREQIQSLAKIRNRLIHFGRLPDHGSVYDDTVLFIRLTENVIAKTLGLNPSNIFNTDEKSEAFFQGNASKKNNFK